MDYSDHRCVYNKKTDSKFLIRQLPLGLADLFSVVFITHLHRLHTHKT